MVKNLSILGYEVAFLGDSDIDYQTSLAELESIGVKIIVWSDGVALEQRLANDLPWPGVAAMVRLAMEEWGEKGVQDAIASRADVDNSKFAECGPEKWLETDVEERTLREAIGLAAKNHRHGKRKGWFKRVDLAEDLAGLVVKHWSALNDTDLFVKLSALRSWVEADV